MNTKFRYKKEFSEIIITLIILTTIGGFFFLVRADRENRLENPQTQNPTGSPNVQEVFESERELEKILDQELGNTNKNQ